MSDETSKPVGVVILGCGNIAEQYVRDIVTYPECRLLGFWNRTTAAAEKFASDTNTRCYRSLDDVLADNTVDIVVNLTLYKIKPHLRWMAASRRPGKQAPRSDRHGGSRTRVGRPRTPQVSRRVSL